MDKAEFDRFAQEYDAQHKANIAITGETPEYFARYKIAELARIVAQAGVTRDRIVDFGSGTGNSIPHFRSFFPGSALACADVSPRSLELASARFPGSEQSFLIEGDRLGVDPYWAQLYDVAVYTAVPFAGARWFAFAHLIEKSANA